MASPRGVTIGPPIIYAHGYGQSCESFWALAGALSSLGRGPMYAYTYSSFDDIEQSADGLDRFIRTVRRATGAPLVDLIGHSMGGLVIVEHLRRAGHQHHVRRCITLASARGGIRWSGPVPGRAASQLRRDSSYPRGLAALRLPIPVLNVASANDDIVCPATAFSERGGRDVSIDAVGHIALLFCEEMFQVAAAFLGEVDLPTEASNSFVPTLAATG